MSLGLKAKVLISGLVAVSSSLVCYKPAQAITIYKEYNPLTQSPVDNVGQTISNAAQLNSGTDMLWGSLLYEENGQRDVDVYRFHWAGGNTNPFEASVQQDWLGSRTHLYLFNVWGYGITKAAGNSGIKFNNLWEGEYFLAIARNHVKLDNNILFKEEYKTGSNGLKTNLEGAVLSDNSWSNLGYGGSHTKNFGYDIEISKTYGAEDVPEPTTILGTLLAGGYGLYRKRRQKKVVG